MGIEDNESNQNVTKTSVVTESVKPKYKRKLKKYIQVIVLAIIGAVVFGVTARIVFIKSDGLLKKILGVDTAEESKNQGADDERRQEVRFDTEVGTVTPGQQDRQPTQSVEPVSTPDVAAVTDTPVASKVPNEDNVNHNTVTGLGKNEKSTGTEAAAKADSAKEDSTGGENYAANGTETGENGTLSLEQYLGVMTELRMMTDEIQKGIVTVRSKTTTANWLGDDISTVRDTFGAVVADNGVELLILTYYDGIMNADSIGVVLYNGHEYKASLLERDVNYNMAVVAVPLETIDENDLAEVQNLNVGTSAEIYAGMPIIALGSPNGIPGSLEYGYVTGCNSRLYVTDGELSLFTTDVSVTDGSEGIIVSYTGDVIGVIARSIESPKTVGISTAIMTDSIYSVAMELCNGRRRPYLGIKAENIPESALAELGQESGIYLNDIDSKSPADAAGLKKGDIILLINGEKVTSVSGFMDEVTKKGDNEGIELLIYRSSRTSNPEMTITVFPEQ